jgi:hypothetical protein
VVGKVAEPLTRGKHPQALPLAYPVPKLAKISWLIVVFGETGISPALLKIYP